MHSNKHGAACGSDGGKSTMLGACESACASARAPRPTPPYLHDRHESEDAAHLKAGIVGEQHHAHAQDRLQRIRGAGVIMRVCVSTHGGVSITSLPTRAYTAATRTRTHTHTRSLPPAYMHRHNAGCYDTDWDAVTLRATRRAGDCVLLRNPKLGPEVGGKIQGCQDWAATFTSNHQPVHTVTACGKAIRSASGLPTGAVGVISSVSGDVTHHSYPLVGWMYVKTR